MHDQGKGMQGLRRHVFRKRMQYTSCIQYVMYYTHMDPVKGMQDQGKDMQGLRMYVFRKRLQYTSCIQYVKCYTHMDPG